MSPLVKIIFLTMFGLCTAICALYGQRRGPVDVKLKFEPIQTIVVKNLSREMADQEPLIVFSTSTYEINVEATENDSYQEHEDKITVPASLDSDALAIHEHSAVTPDAPDSVTDSRNDRLTHLPRFTPLRSGHVAPVYKTALTYTLSTK